MRMLRLCDRQHGGKNQQQNGVFSVAERKKPGPKGPGLLMRCVGRVLLDPPST